MKIFLDNSKVISDSVFTDKKATFPRFSINKLRTNCLFPIALEIRQSPIVQDFIEAVNNASTISNITQKSELPSFIKQVSLKDSQLKNNRIIWEFNFPLNQQIVIGSLANLFSTFYVNIDPTKKKGKGSNKNKSFIGVQEQQIENIIETLNGCLGDFLKSNRPIFQKQSLDKIYRVVQNQLSNTTHIKSIQKPQIRQLICKMTSVALIFENQIKKAIIDEIERQKNPVVQKINEEQESIETTKDEEYKKVEVDEKQKQIRTNEISQDVKQGWIDDEGDDFVSVEGDEELEESKIQQNSHEKSKEERSSKDMKGAVCKSSPKITKGWPQTKQKQINIDDQIENSSDNEGPSTREGSDKQLENEMITAHFTENQDDEKEFQPEINLGYFEDTKQKEQDIKEEEEQIVDNKKENQGGLNTIQINTQNTDNNDSSSIQDNSSLLSSTISTKSKSDKLYELYPGIFLENLEINFQIIEDCLNFEDAKEEQESTSENTNEIKNSYFYALRYKTQKAFTPNLNKKKLALPRPFIPKSPTHSSSNGQFDFSLLRNQGVRSTPLENQQQYSSIPNQTKWNNNDYKNQGGLDFLSPLSLNNSNYKFRSNDDFQYQGGNNSNNNQYFQQYENYPIKSARDRSRESYSSYNSENYSVNNRYHDKPIGKYYQRKYPKKEDEEEQQQQQQQEQQEEFQDQEFRQEQQFKFNNNLKLPEEGDNYKQASYPIRKRPGKTIEIKKSYEVKQPQQSSHSPQKQSVNKYYSKVPPRFLKGKYENYSQYKADEQGQAAE